VKSKLQQIREAWAANDRIGALRIAAHFHDRSADTITFKRGYDAYNHAAFYRQLGKDPHQLTRLETSPPIQKQEVGFSIFGSPWRPLKQQVDPRIIENEEVLRDKTVMLRQTSEQKYRTAKSKLNLIKLQGYCCDIA
jgi:hypothetical protein